MLDSEKPSKKSKRSKKKGEEPIEEVEVIKPEVEVQAKRKKKSKKVLEEEEELVVAVAECEPAGEAVEKKKSKKKRGEVLEAEPTPLRRTVFTSAPAIPSSLSLPMTDLQLAEIQSKIKAIEFALESFADYENEEERRKFLRQNFTAVPHLKIYYKLTEEALLEMENTLQKKENTLLEMENTLQKKENTLLEIQLRSLTLPPPPGQ